MKPAFIGPALPKNDEKNKSDEDEDKKPMIGPIFKPELTKKEIGPAFKPESIKKEEPQKEETDKPPIGPVFKKNIDTKPEKPKEQLKLPDFIKPTKKMNGKSLSPVKSKKVSLVQYEDSSSTDSNDSKGSSSSKGFKNKLNKNFLKSSEMFKTFLHNVTSS